jgi:hypothetical protein
METAGIEPAPSVCKTNILPLNYISNYLPILYTLGGIRTHNA